MQRNTLCVILVDGRRCVMMIVAMSVIQNITCMALVNAGHPWTAGTSQ